MCRIPWGTPPNKKIRPSNTSSVRQISRHLRSQRSLLKHITRTRATTLPSLTVLYLTQDTSCDPSTTIGSGAIAQYVVYGISIQDVTTTIFMHSCVTTSVISVSPSVTQTIATQYSLPSISRGLKQVSFSIHLQDSPFGVLYTVPIGIHTYSTTIVKTSDSSFPCRSVPTPGNQLITSTMSVLLALLSSQKLPHTSQMSRRCLPK